jgi:hypothetical protein
MMNWVASVLGTSRCHLPSICVRLFGFSGIATIPPFDKLGGAVPTITPDPALSRIDLDDGEGPPLFTSWYSTFVDPGPFETFNFT